MPRPLPSPRTPARRLVVALTVVGAASLPLAAQARPEPPARPDPYVGVGDVVAASLDNVRPATPPAPPEVQVEATDEAAPAPLAVVGGVELVSPSPDALIHGFHEGSTKSHALEPVEDGAEHVVMPSRGRSTPPTSAVDVAMEEGIEVLSPVSGTVVEVSDYSLYGNTPDVLISVRPDDNPDLVVRIFHVVDAAVAVGDPVVAGETVVAASSRQLPFGSQIDRFSGATTPHVHIQVDRY